MVNNARQQPSSHMTQGFTLVELVVGMLMMSIALVAIATTLFPQNERVVDTVFRVRSAELGQSVFNEIWGKRFDEQAELNGGIPCNSVGMPACTLAVNYGPDVGEGRDDWDDIDDYHGMTETSEILNSTQTYAQLYPNYQLLVTIGELNGGSSKLIEIAVTTPNGEKIVFHGVRSNY